MSNNWTKIGSFIQEHTKGITPKYVENSNTMVLNQKCIRDNLIDYSFVQFVDDNQRIREDKYLRVGDILINSTGQGTAGRVAFVESLPGNKKLTIDSHILILRCDNIIVANLIRYSLFSFENTLMTFIDGSSGQGEFDRVRLFGTKIKLPIENNGLIVKLLSSLDKKIELNNRIISELETMAKELYNYWFVQLDFPYAKGKPYRSSGGKIVYNEILKREIPEGWEVKTLLDIATYTNGIACQNNRPTNNDEKLRVIKIKEMHNGFSEDTEFVTSNIPEKVKVYNGDVLFSWSASLEVMLWGLGEGGLNQHIFKVTSDAYPREYLYFQLLGYIEHFKKIAEARKTTMGHITQDHLEQSRIVVPQNGEIILKFQKATKPILDKIIAIQREKIELAALRDWLLPMLMNGQVTVQTEEKEQTKQETPITNLSQQQNQRFELWLTNQGVAARGDIDKATLREVFDAMDEDDK